MKVYNPVTEKPYEGVIVYVTERTNKSDAYGSILSRPRMPPSSGACFSVAITSTYFLRAFVMRENTY